MAFRLCLTVVVGCLCFPACLNTNDLPEYREAEAPRLTDQAPGPDAPARSQVGGSSGGGSRTPPVGGKMPHMHDANVSEQSSAGDASSSRDITEQDARVMGGMGIDADMVEMVNASMRDADLTDADLTDAEGNAPDMGAAEPPDHIQDCPDTEVCYDLPNDLWRYVFVRTHVDEGMPVLPEWCPAGYGEPIEQNYYQNPVGAPECEPCRCELTANDCGSASLHCAIGSDSCDEEVTQQLNFEGGCSNLSPPENGDIACYSEAGVYGGDCTSTGGQIIDAPAFETRWSMCRLMGGRQCGGRRARCLPKGQRLCYVQPDGVPCAEGTVEHLVISNYVDSRRCSDCRCHVDGVRCSAPVFRLRLRPDCQPDFGPLPAFGPDCTSLEMSFQIGAQWSVDEETSEIIGTCEPGVSEGRGGVTDLDGFTSLCCADL